MSKCSTTDAADELLSLIRSHDDIRALAWAVIRLDPELAGRFGSAMLMAASHVLDPDDAEST
jgi:hypothetical protein